MAEAEGTTVTLQPRVVEYDPVTGVPPEFNEFLPPECMEYKRWKASQEGPEALEKLTLKDKDGNELEKAPGGKIKKKEKPLVVIETHTRNKKKMTTTITGLELFGIKLGEAAKAFGKKFACGASVTKNASGTEQIDMQGDYLDQLAELLVKTYGKSHGLSKQSVYYIEEKKKKAYFGDSEEEGSGDEGPSK